MSVDETVTQCRGILVRGLMKVVESGIGIKKRMMRELSRMVRTSHWPPILASFFSPPRS